MEQIIAFIMAIVSFLSSLFGVYLSDLADGVNADTRFFLRFKEYKAYIYKDGDVELPFRLLEPTSSQDGALYPLIVYLHGAGETGKNNKDQLQRFFAKGLENSGEACYAFLPQIEGDWFWGDAHVDAVLNKCIDDYLLAAYPIDIDRIYVTGLSRGGNGVYEQVYLHQGKYAAALPVCGYLYRFDETVLSNFQPFADIPMWIAHNAGDPTVSVEHSRLMYSSVLALGGTQIIYTEYAKNKHDAWTAFYSDRDVWTWMFAQRLRGGEAPPSPFARHLS